MTTSPKTGSSTPRLSEVARHVVVPKGAVTTGWPAVRKKCGELGISFRPWQEAAGGVILAKREDGRYASTIGGTGLSIPRQVGKTFLLGAIVFALCLLRPKLTVIWTSHRLRTGEETFKKMLAMSRRKKIAPHMLRPVLGSGEEEIRFRNGSRILFGARERGFGRGFDEVDVLIFDEAQILSANALDDMVPATNQSRQPTSALLLFAGTPPKPTDPSEVFTRMRTEALAGSDEDTGWIEFGADPGYVPPESPAPLGPKDWAQVAKANPSYPVDTPREAILRMRKQLGPDSYPREGLGIWDDVDVSASTISGTDWGNLLEAGSGYGGNGHVALGLHITGDRATACVVVVGERADGLAHVEMYEPIATSRAVGFLKAKTEQLGCPVFIDGTSHANSLVPALDAERVQVEPLSLPKYAQGVGMVVDAVANKELRHIGSPGLGESVTAARVKPSGRDAWIWDGTGLAPLKALTLALYGYSSDDSAPFNIW